MLVYPRYTDDGLLTIISTVNRLRRHGWWNLFSVEENERKKEKGKERVTERERERGAGKEKERRKGTSVQTRLAVSSSPTPRQSRSRRIETCSRAKALLLLPACTLTYIC